MFFVLSALLGAAMLSGMLVGNESEETDEVDDGDMPRPSLDFLDENSANGGNGKPIEDSTALTVFDDEYGEFIGGDLNDVLVVRTETGDDMSQLWDRYIEQSTPLEIRGGEGDDRLDLHGGGYVARGDEGSDRIDLNGASNLAVFAGHGDSVFGGTGSNIYVNLSENASFFGGSASEFVLSSSSSTIHLHDGNDVFFGVSGGELGGAVSQKIFGDEGNDYLQGSIREQDLWWEHSNDEGSISHDSDSLFGGSGDDTIVGSHGDVLAGGSGIDSFKAVLNSDPNFKSVLVTDFDPLMETLEIYFGGELDSGGSLQIGSLKFSDFEVNESEGSTVLSTAQGQELLRLEGVLEAKVGVQVLNKENGLVDFRNLNGDLIDRASCAVLILCQRL